MFRSWLRSWFRRGPPPPPGRLHLLLYTRQGCHLCDDALERLQAERRRWSFQLEVVDIDTDPALAAEHGEQVPVVTVNGQVRFRGGVNPVLLTRLLRAEARKKD